MFAILERCVQHLFRVRYLHSEVRFRLVRTKQCIYPGHPEEPHCLQDYYYRAHHKPRYYVLHIHVRHLSQQVCCTGNCTTQQIKINDSRTVLPACLRCGIQQHVVSNRTVVRHGFQLYIRKFLNVAVTASTLLYHPSGKHHCLALVIHVYFIIRVCYNLLERYITWCILRVRGIQGVRVRLLHLSYITVGFYNTHNYDNKSSVLRD